MICRSVLLEAGTIERPARNQIESVGLGPQPQLELLDFQWLVVNLISFAACKSHTILGGHPG